MRNLIILLITTIFSTSVLAQQTSPTPDQKKYDKLLMKSGEEKEGTVSEITDDAVKFVHKGETLNYTFKKSDIVKITFASGRVEILNPAGSGQGTGTDPAASNTPVSKEDHHNKVAVVPFVFINQHEGGDPEIGYKIQDECYNMLGKKAAALQIQDPQTTNALLGKAGVTRDNYRSFTMKEICDILGVEYVVRGTVTLNASSVSSSSSTSGQVKTDGNKTDKNGNPTDGKFSGSTYSSSSQNYSTSVTMEMHTDDGKKVFGESRTSFWNSADAYKSTLQYLLKKSPIYGR